MKNFYNVKDNVDEHRGELSSSEADKAPLESRMKLKQPDELSLHCLKRWGPWKRWMTYREIQQYNREDPDIEENESGRLPADEGVHVPAIWVTELYTPSTVGGLLKGISELDWEYGSTRDNSLTKWMADVREGRQAGWISLGLVSPPDAVHLMKERTAPLPSGVIAALPILMSLTPSLTAFIVAFLFDDKTARSLENPLRADFATRTRRDPLYRPWHVVRYILMNGSIRLGHRIYSADMIRREAVKSHLKKLENACVMWVQKRFPGTFASLPHSEAPTAILLVTEQARPLSDESRKTRAFDGLAINREYDAWESDKWPGARLVLPRGWDEEGKRLIFACRRKDAFPDKAEHHDSTSNWTIAQRADVLIQRLLSRWAITGLLDSYHVTLAVLRDQAARDSGYRPVRDLKELRSLARTMLYDIGVCTEEIIEFSKSDLRYRYSVLDMFYVRETGGVRPELLKDFMVSQSKRAQQIQREAVLLSSTLSTSNNLTQTISSIRTQRLVILLTIVSIGVASWTAFLTFSGAS